MWREMCPNIESKQPRSFILQQIILDHTFYEVIDSVNSLEIGQIFLSFHSLPVPVETCVELVSGAAVVLVVVGGAVVDETLVVVVVTSSVLATPVFWQPFSATISGRVSSVIGVPSLPSITIVTVNDFTSSGL